MKNYKVVNLRAAAILLIVLNHSVIFYDSLSVSPFFHYLRTFITTYHLTLFFALSGFLFYRTIKKGKDAGSFIADKLKRIIVPFLAVGFLWVIPIEKYAVETEYNDMSLANVVFKQFLWGLSRRHLWFLPTLFIIMCVMYLLCSFINSTKHHALWHIVTLAALLAVSLYYKPLSGSFISIKSTASVLRYCFWFYLGYVLGEYETAIDSAKAKAKTAVGILLAAAAVAAMTYLIAVRVNTYVTYAAGITGIIGAYLLVPNKACKVTEFLDKNSFGLYLFHSCFVYFLPTYMPDMNVYLAAALNFFVGGLLSLGMVYLVRALKLGFIIGEYPKKANKEIKAA